MSTPSVSDNGVFVAQDSKSHDNGRVGVGKASQEDQNAKSIVLIAKHAEQKSKPKPKAKLMLSQPSPSQGKTLGETQQQQQQQQHQHQQSMSKTKTKTSSDSIGSTEIAIERGSIRAMIEGNDLWIHNMNCNNSNTSNNPQTTPIATATAAAGATATVTALTTGLDFDLGTISTTAHGAAHWENDNIPVRNRKSGFFQFHSKRTSPRNYSNHKLQNRKISNDIISNNHGMSELVAGISNKAWMCGCCGKVFSTFDAAEFHETKCILQVIQGKSSTINSTINNNSNNNSNNTGMGINQDKNETKQHHTLRHHRSFLDEHQPHHSSQTNSKSKRQPHLKSIHTDVDFRLQEYIRLRSNSERSIYQSARSGEDDPIWNMILPNDSSNNSNSNTNINIRKFQQNNDNHNPEYAKSKGRSRTVSFQEGDVFANHLNENHFVVPANLQTRKSSIRQAGTSTLPLPPPLAPISHLHPLPPGLTRADDIMEPASILLTRSMKQQVIVTDEALVNAVSRAVEWILTPAERDAERALEYIVADKLYYDDMLQRACVLKAHPSAKFRSEGKNVASRIQNKFVDAWQLIKEGDKENVNTNDEYLKFAKTNRGGRGDVDKKELVHHVNTQYVNVIVKHSLRVVNSELERLAQQRWEDHGDANRGNFEQFRKFAHVNLVKLAKLALAADFTPRKVAVQLSNDLYRLMAPQLKRRGVAIDAEIEYRVGPYFVLAVNIISIDWTKLIKYSHRLVTKQKKEWIADQGRREELREDLLLEERKHAPPPARLITFGSAVNVPFRLHQMTRFDILAEFLSWMYLVHWTISIPICWILHHFFIESTINKYILSTVADEVFSYVEEKGMEMNIQIMSPNQQTAFMLSALRELRQDTRAQKDKTKDKDRIDKGEILGPLMGPAIKSDKGPAPQPPPGFEMPENLEFVNLEISLPVGFKRLRWALLSPSSNFQQDALLREGKCENIIIKEWTHHKEVIGSPNPLPEGISEQDIVGAEREAEYLMPKSTFVGANTVFDTNQIIAYNDYCLCIKKRTLSPEVPYGKTFVTWTQILIVNTGNDSCHLTTSVEAEFPNGPPIISRQIISGMRSGTAESFVLMSEVIIKYADEYP